MYDREREEREREDEERASTVTLWESTTGYRRRLRKYYSRFEKNRKKYESFCRQAGFDPNRTLFENYNAFAASCRYGEKNASERSILEMRNRFCNLLLQPIAENMKAPDAELVSGIGSFFAERMGNYDSGKPFMPYFVWLVPFCIVDNFRDDHGMKRLTKAELDELARRGEAENAPAFVSREISYNVPISEDEDDGTMLDTLAADGDAASELMENKRLIELTMLAVAAMLNLEKYLSKREDNPVRRNYLHLIFTDRMSYSVRNIPGLCGTLERHEREILRQMKPLLLKYALRMDFPDPELDRFYLSAAGNYCSLRELFNAHARNLAELFGDEEDQPIKEPFPAKVLLGYLREKEGVIASPTVLSQNVGHYEELMAQVRGRA